MAKEKSFQSNFSLQLDFIASKNTGFIATHKLEINGKCLRAGSCAIDFTQSGHHKCFGTK